MKTILKIFPLLFVFLMCSLLNAQSEGILNEGDKLAIRLPGEKRFQSYQIDLLGEILLPTVGKVKIVGLTTNQAALKIHRALPLYLRKISLVEVHLLNKRKAVRVWGHVKDPGWKIVPADATIEEILNSAHGSLDGTLLNKIMIHHSENDKDKIFIANLSRFKKEGDISILPKIENGDVITVLQTEEMGDVQQSLTAQRPRVETQTLGFKEGIRIYGAVGKPGLYKLVEEGTFYDMLISAGGLTRYADLNKVYINRPTASGIKRICVPIKNVIKKGNFRSLPALNPGDMIYVHTKSSTWKNLVSYFRDISIIATSVILVSRFYP